MVLQLPVKYRAPATASVLVSVPFFVLSPGFLFLSHLFVPQFAMAAVELLHIDFIMFNFLLLMTLYLASMVTITFIFSGKEDRSFGVTFFVTLLPLLIGALLMGVNAVIRQLSLSE